MSGEVWRGGQAAVGVQQVLEQEVEELLHHVEQVTLHTNPTSIVCHLRAAVPTQLPPISEVLLCTVHHATLFTHDA